MRISSLLSPNIIEKRLPAMKYLDGCRSLGFKSHETPDDSERGGSPLTWNNLPSEISNETMRRLNRGYVDAIYNAQ
jgi:hypothetical protein